MNEGSLYHGPLYTRPSYNLPRITNPLFGLGTTEPPSTGMLLVGFIGMGVLTYLAAEVFLPKPRRSR